MNIWGLAVPSLSQPFWLDSGVVSESLSSLCSNSDPRTLLESSCLPFLVKETSCSKLSWRRSSWVIFMGHFQKTIGYLDKHYNHSGIVKIVQKTEFRESEMWVKTENKGYQTSEILRVRISLSFWATRQTLTSLSALSFSDPTSHHGHWLQVEFFVSDPMYRTGCTLNKHEAHSKKHMGTAIWTYSCLQVFSHWCGWVLWRTLWRQLRVLQSTYREAVRSE